ncbi:MAG: phosphatidylserine decarboxylase family protein [Thermodesulfobacteriota bacterium]
MEQYKWADPQKRTAFPVAEAGYPFIFAGGFITAVFALTGLTVPAMISLIFWSFTCWFFRDPDRVIPIGDGLVVSPADGRVIKTDIVPESPLGESTSLKISIFMSVFNVHVNRIPCDGAITGVSYFPGKFFSANLDKASEDNEHNQIFMQTDTGQSVCFVQIAGLVARRIICHLTGNETVARGQRFGMICFGSRLDVYLPADTRLRVKIGDKVKAGTSVLGSFQ